MFFLKASMYMHVAIGHSLCIRFIAQVTILLVSKSEESYKKVYMLRYTGIVFERGKNIVDIG